jgi:hypothetical protein
MARKAQELRPVMVRLPEKLRRRLERAAFLSGRSMNSEIIYLLEHTFTLWGDPPTPAQHQREMAQIERWWKKRTAWEAEVERTLERLKRADKGEAGKS